MTAWTSGASILGCSDQLLSLPTLHTVPFTLDASPGQARSQASWSPTFSYAALLTGLWSLTSRLDIFSRLSPSVRWSCSAQPGHQVALVELPGVGVGGWLSGAQ